MAEYEIRLNSRQIQRLSRSGELTDAMQRAGQIVEREAKRLAPVLTGNLRRSIYHEVQRDNLGVVARVGTNVKYGIFQELGTRYHDAQPYLRPALEALRRELRRR